VWIVRPPFGSASGQPRLERDRIAADADRAWRDASDFAGEGIDSVGAAESRERSGFDRDGSASV
jgi:hypothetical protein